MTYRKILLLLVAGVFFSIAQAQILTVPYQYGFEQDDAEEKNWKLNIGDRGKFCKDQWMIGNLEHSEGYRSLYISCDKGVTSNYGMSPNVVVATRTLELASGNYDISFDWKVWGEDLVSELYVCALPDNYKINEEELTSNDTIGFFPKLFSRFIQPLGTTEGVTTSLSGSTMWSNASFPISVVGGRKVQLAFVWVNANQDSTLSSPIGACIDNIQINSALCPKPENLSSTETSCGVLSISWDGSAPEYECGYKPVGSKYWNNEYDIDGEKTTSLSFSWDGVAEGAYDVRVRAIADNDTSAYVYLNTVVVWCPDNHCFDFVSLNNKEIVTCEAGAAIIDPLAESSEYVFATVPPIDYGSNSIYSRHTTNWTQGEFDPRTGNRLRTIPQNELASVRLGNWNSGGEAERITYQFDVVDDVVLLMKYAVVLENPGHGEAFDPYFGLEILKEDGTPISKNATCGEAFFSPKKDSAAWNYSGAFVWKDWSTIGIDLRECKGQKIKIQLTTQDCTPGAHGGYAYFTLDCIDATIKSEGCEKIKLEAPLGFKYLWYNKTNPKFQSTTNQSIFVSAGDTTTYYCDVNYQDNNDCTFTLSSSVIPHNPKAEFVYDWVPANCENIVKFENRSKVIANINGVDSILQGKRCDHYLWKLEFNGQVTLTDLANPRYVMPNEGGVLKATLSAYLSDEQCEDIFTQEIAVPAIHGHNITLDKELCFGDYVILGDNFIMESGTWIDTVPNQWGCDSITTLNVTVRPQIEDVVVYDTICGSNPYIIGDYRFDSSGVYTVKLVSNDYLKCDSVVILHLHKEIPIGIVLSDEKLHACADDGNLLVSYEIEENTRSPYLYSIIFDDLALSAGFENVISQQVDLGNQSFVLNIPDSCRPNYYTATIVIEDTISTCGEILLPIKFEIYYSSSILQPKFGNMVTVYDSLYNGGYTFVEYQWYRNNIAIDNANNAYYVLSVEEGSFGENDCFYLLAKRAGDGVTIRTCEICPGPQTAVDDVYFKSDIITVVECNQQVELGDFGVGEIRLFSMSGLLVDSKEIDSYDSKFRAPSIPGVYLLQIKAEKISFVTKLVVNIKK